MRCGKKLGCVVGTLRDKHLNEAEKGTKLWQALLNTLAGKTLLKPKPHTLPLNPHFLLVNWIKTTPLYDNNEGPSRGGARSCFSATAVPNFERLSSVRNVRTPYFEW